MLNKRGINFILILQIILIIVAILFLVNLFQGIAYSSSKVGMGFLIDPIKRVLGTIGYGEIGLFSVINAVNILAIIIASLGLAYLLNAQRKIINALESKEEDSSDLEIVSRTGFNKTENITTSISVILIMLYLGLAFIPIVQILRPILLPLFSNYGIAQVPTILHVAIIGGLAFLLKGLFNKEGSKRKISIIATVILVIIVWLNKQLEGIWDNSIFIFINRIFLTISESFSGAELILYKAIGLTVWIGLPFIIIATILRFPEAITMFYYKRIKKPIQDAKAQERANDILTGVGMLGAVGKQVRNKS